MSPSRALDDVGLVVLGDRPARQEDVGQQAHRRPMPHRGEVRAEIAAGGIAEPMTRGARAGEHLRATRRIAREVERGRVAAHRVGALPRILLEHRARRRANRRVLVEHEILLLPEAEAPRLHRPRGQRVDQQTRARRVVDEHVAGVGPDVGRERGPLRQEEASNRLARGERRLLAGGPAGRRKGVGSMRPSAVTAATWTTSGSCGATNRASHSTRRSGRSIEASAMASARRCASVPCSAVVIARCTAARHAASSPGPASRSRPSVPARTSAAASSCSASRDARAPCSILRAERRPCAPCARPSSTAARHHDASASRAAAHGVEDTPHLGRPSGAPR